MRTLNLLVMVLVVAIPVGVAVKTIVGHIIGKIHDRYGEVDLFGGLDEDIN